MAQEIPIQKLTNDSFDLLLREEPLPVLVNFSADWSGPCHIMTPILEDLAVKFAGKIKLYKIDIEQFSDKANIYGVYTVPTIVFFKNGEVVGHECGVVSKSDIEKKIAEIIDIKLEIK